MYIVCQSLHVYVIIEIMCVHVCAVYDYVLRLLRGCRYRSLMVVVHRAWFTSSIHMCMSCGLRLALKWLPFVVNFRVFGAGKSHE